jgi:uncharacterized protein (DUF433 family)
MERGNFITIDPNKRFGKPIISGTRITVSDILNWLGNGMTKNEILEDYPELSEEKINAALFYAANRYDHLGFAS